jgi:hypothetical protein
VEDAVLRIVPNPTHGATTLALSLLRPELTVIAIHDVQGRLKTLYRSFLGTGLHSLRLREDLGSPELAPGVYVISVRRGSSQQTTRMVISP